MFTRWYNHVARCTDNDHAEVCHTHLAAPTFPACDVAMCIKDKYAESVSHTWQHQRFQHTMWQCASKTSMQKWVKHTWQPQCLQQLGATCHLATSYLPPQALPAAGQNLSAQFPPSCWFAVSCLQQLGTSFRYRQWGREVGFVPHKQSCESCALSASLLAGGWASQPHEEQSVQLVGTP